MWKVEGESISHEKVLKSDESDKRGVTSVVVIREDVLIVAHEAGHGTISVLRAWKRNVTGWTCTKQYSDIPGIVTCNSQLRNGMVVVGSRKRKYVSEADDSCIFYERGGLHVLDVERESSWTWKGNRTCQALYIVACMASQNCPMAE